MKKISFLSIIAINIILIGCSISPSYKTDVIPIEDNNKHIVNIDVDQEVTFFGKSQESNIVRVNYKYALAASAQAAKDAGFKYFSIIEPERLLKQYKKKNVSNIQEAYDTCAKGDESFKIHADYIHSRFWKNHYKDDEYNCSTITYKHSHSYLMGGTGVHKNIKFKIELHNDLRPNSNSIFNANDVLNSDLIKSLNKNYFVKNKR